MFCIIPKKKETIRSIGDHISSTPVIQTAVLQGYVLGLFFFLLYINDLNKSLQAFESLSPYPRSGFFIVNFEHT